MSEELQVPPKPKKKRKVKARRAPAAKKPAAAAVVPSEFAGMTVAKCCNDCGEAGCVISGKPYCAHPRKGGLHAEDMGGEAGKRLRAAEKALGEQLLAVKFD